MSIEDELAGMRAELRELRGEVVLWRERVEQGAAIIMENVLRITALERRIEQLEAALARIDGLNDNPAVYNPAIDEVLRAVWVYPTERRDEDREILDDVARYEERG